MDHMLEDSVTLHFPVECIHVFRLILKINSDYFLKQRFPVDGCNEDMCFL
jgi:hypothetical protein